ncbi:MAG: cell division topological specificity factor MinE [Candidatus Epulonipiscium fishelsonii]|nr:MAG: cell division topological specificity factor MinE [Epulopiscium sp. AS2M-Bin002]
MDLNQLFSKKNQSGSLAKDRLKLLLIHDRVNCAPELLEMMKADILAVISKYVEVEQDELSIEVATLSDIGMTEKLPVLSANIPIKNLRKIK